MTTILDRNGAPIEVGARVIEDGEECGTVRQLTDPDGDVNAEGRQVAYGPFVIVQYDDDEPGEVVEWAASWNATGPWDDHRSDYTCDDVEVAA